MASRSRAWARIYSLALARLAVRTKATADEVPKRVLLPHHSRLGDTLMLTATVAKVRERYPDAEIVHAMPEAFTPLFQRAPYGASVIGWNATKPDSLDALFESGPFDLALVNGDARFSWLAAAMESRRIVAFAHDRPAYKNWPVDVAVPMPTEPMSWSDLVTTLVPGPAPTPFRCGSWGPPDCAPFERPGGDYVVLHVGASHVHKLWDPSRWAALAAALAGRGLEVAWSAGPGEEALVSAIPGADKHRSYAGTLRLEQLWNLLAGARLVVSLDTSALHMARAACAPTVGLFGPSGPLLGGPGSFWRDCPSRSHAIDPFACRDQTGLFKREVAWLRRCSRGLDECPRARCMDALTVEETLAFADEMRAI
jgi:ADP-heptose:LPS heptosyltransferase